MPRNDLQRILLDTRDPLKRARAHLRLGQLALQEGDHEVAVRHFREALMLDAALDEARSSLRRLGELSTLVLDELPKQGSRRFALRGMVRKIIRREVPDA